MNRNLCSVVSMRRKLHQYCVVLCIDIFLHWYFHPIFFRYMKSCSPFCIKYNPVQLHKSSELFLFFHCDIIILHSRYLYNGRLNRFSVIMKYRAILCHWIWISSNLTLHLFKDTANGKMLKKRQIRTFHWRWLH